MIIIIWSRLKLSHSRTSRSANHKQRVSGESIMANYIIYNVSRQHGGHKLINYSSNYAEDFSVSFFFRRLLFEKDLQSSNSRMSFIEPS